MQKYGEYRPTQFDPKGSFLREQGDWLVIPCGRNRDSLCLDESNFHTAVTLLGGESETVEIHRFGHWACGWYEIIIVKPEGWAADIAAKIEADLDNYPVLDEDDWTNRESEAKWEYWDSLPLSIKVDECRDAGVSIFAARGSIPERIYDELEV